MASTRGESHPNEIAAIMRHKSTIMDEVVLVAADRISVLSTQTPKTGPVKSEGAKDSPAINPTNPAEAVRSHAIQTSATLCIQTAFTFSRLPKK